MRKAGVALGDGELSDYLPAVLGSWPRCRPRRTGRRSSTRSCLPGLTRMTEALKDTDSPWADVLRALPSFLAPLGGGEPLPPPERVDDVDLEADALA